MDGYADLVPGGRPGLGAHAHAEFGTPRGQIRPQPPWPAANPADLRERTERMHERMFRRRVVRYLPARSRTQIPA